MSFNNETNLVEDVKNIGFFEAPEDLNERQFSKDLDRKLGFKIPNIERKLLKNYRAYYKDEDDSNRKKHYGGTQTWIGLHPQVLQTPYGQIVQFFKILKNMKISRVVDLGAGYGRVGIVQKAFYPDSEFVGYEIMDERLDEGKRIFDLLELKDCELLKQNILDEDFEIPKADLYFIYDFSDPGDLRIILDKLQDKVFKERFFLVAKGEGIRSLIQLKYPQFWAAHGVIHKKDWSLYSSFIDLN